MSSRSSPLSGLSPSPPIRPIALLAVQQREQQSPREVAGAEAGPSRSRLSSGSPLSNADEEEEALELPPSSFPEVPDEAEAAEDEGEDGRDTRSQTSETVPLGSDESDLTEEEEEDDGIGIVSRNTSVKPEPVEARERDEDGSDGGPSPHMSKIKRIISAPGSAPRTPLDPAPAHSPSPSLTPPPSESARSRPVPASVSPKKRKTSVSPKLEPDDLPTQQEEGDVAEGGAGDVVDVADPTSETSVDKNDMGAGSAEATKPVTPAIETNHIVLDLDLAEQSNLGPDVEGDTGMEVYGDGSSLPAGIEAAPEEAPAEPEPDVTGDVPSHEDDTPAQAIAQAPSTHSSHAPPPTQAAMRALLTLEVKFAALRDRLYIERMEEAAEEEEMILSGTHPALQMLHKTLSQRRERLHELASRRHAQAVEELKVGRKAEQDAVWSWWTDERDRTHWAEFEQTWSKRRRLAREKNEIESVRYIKAVPDGVGKGFDWSAGPSPTRLTIEEGNRDLALMEQRQIQLSRQASPAVFPPLSAFSIPQQPQQYLGYPGGQTYAEAVGAPPAAPQSRPGTSSTTAYAHYAQAPTREPHHIPAPVAGYSSAGLMDQFAYPRSATAVGPSSLPPPTQQQQQQQPRREGRTVPTASTLFRNHCAELPPFPMTPFARPISEGAYQHVSVDFTTSSTTATIGKDVRHEAKDSAGGLYDQRASALPLAYSMGFGMGLGGSTPGFGTLGSTRENAQPSTSSAADPADQRRTATPGAAGTNGGLSPVSSTKPAPPSIMGGYGYWQNAPAHSLGTGSGNSGIMNGNSGNGPVSGHSSINGDHKAASGSPAPGLSSNGPNGLHADREKEREKDRPRYPGLAEYLSGQTFSGLGRMGVLDPPKAVARSPFPPVPSSNPQTASLPRS